MSSSLLPEKTLQISPSLAATIGLEEAALFSILGELLQHRNTEDQDGYAWLTLDSLSITRFMPFWSAHDVQRLGASLRDKGIILIDSAPFTSSGVFRFSLNEKLSAPSQTPDLSQAPSTVVPTPAPANTTAISAAKTQVQTNNNEIKGNTLITPNWQPSAEQVGRLADFGIPPHFARDQVTEFISYWRGQNERFSSGEWNHKFLAQVRKKWADHQNSQGAKEQIMSNTWQPNANAMDIMLRMKQIPEAFCDDSIPEFILYWQEKAPNSGSWNSKFVAHVERQWKRFTHALQHDTEPRPISTKWQPSNDVYDVLQLANIDINFANQLIKEFVIYWHDSNQLNSSWNAKFIQHSKHMWAKRHQLTTQSTRERSLHEDLTDTNW